MNNAGANRKKPWDGYRESNQDREYMEVIRSATGALQTTLASISKRGGVMTYPTHVLGQLKMATLIGEQPRQVPHDVFDIAWFMDRHGHLVDDAHLANLKKWLDEASGAAEEWRDQFRRRQGQKWDWDETIETMSDGLERANETVKEGRALATRMREVYRRTGNAKIGGVVNANGQIWGTITGGDGKTINYGQIARSEVIAVALEALGNVKKRDIPELVLMLENDRVAQQAQARTRSIT